jgi:hypothetical protein
MYFLPPALPNYTLETDHGLATMRGDPSPAMQGEVLHYRGNTMLDWTLRAEVEVEGDVATKLFAISEEGVGRELDVRADVFSSGTVSLRIPAAELGLEPGAWTIVWVVGRRRALPDELANLELESGRNMVVRKVAIVIED